eukprot:6212031-Pleurochrysis_carterae.AAC.1
MECSYETHIFPIFSLRRSSSPETSLPLLQHCAVRTAQVQISLNENGNCNIDHDLIHDDQINDGGQRGHRSRQGSLFRRSLTVNARLGKSS